MTLTQGNTTPPQKFQHDAIDLSCLPEFEGFADRILTCFEDWRALLESHKVSHQQIIIEGTSYRTVEKTVPDVNRILKQHSSQIFEFLETEICALKHFESGVFSFLVEDLEGQRKDRFDKQVEFWETVGKHMEDTWSFRKPVSPVENPLTFDGIKQNIVWYLLRTVKEIIDDCSKPTLDDRKMMEIYAHHYSSWQNANQIRVIVAPLLGYSSAIEEICLDRGFKIKRFTDFEKMELCNTWNGIELASSSLTVSQLAGCKFLIYSEIEAPKSEKMFPSGVKIPSATNVVDDIYSIVTALRLTRLGDIGVPCIFNLPESEWIGNGVTLFNSLSTCNKGPGRMDYMLTAEDEPSLCATSEVLMCSEKSLLLQDIKVGLRRFNIAHSRKSTSDGVIDLAIAIENLLLANKDRSMSSGICAGNRGVALIGVDETSELIKTTLSQLYRVRNTIVHRGYSFDEACHYAEIQFGEHLGIFRTNCNTFWENCLEIARQICIAYGNRLIDGETKEQIIDSLDCYSETNT